MSAINYNQFRILLSTKADQLCSNLIRKMSVPKVIVDVLFVVFLFSVILLLPSDLNAQTVDAENLDHTTTSTDVRPFGDTIQKPKAEATNLPSSEDELGTLGNEAIDKISHKKKSNAETQEVKENSELIEVEIQSGKSNETESKIVIDVVEIPQVAKQSKTNDAIETDKESNENLEAVASEKKEAESTTKSDINSDAQNLIEQSTQVESANSDTSIPTQNNETQPEKVESNTNTLSEVSFVKVEDFIALSGDVDFLSEKVIGFQDDLEVMTLQMSTLRQDMQQVKDLVKAIQSEKDIQAIGRPAPSSQVSELENIIDRINRIEQRLALAESRIAGVGNSQLSPGSVPDKPSDEVVRQQENTKPATTLPTSNEQRLRLVTSNQGESALFTIRVAKNKYQRSLIDSERCSEVGDWVLKSAALLQKTSIILSKDGRLGICKLLATGEWKFFTGVSGNDRGHIVLGGEG